MQLHSAHATHVPLDAGGQLRSISSELGTVLVDTLGLAAAVEWQVRRFQKLTGIICDLSVKAAAECGLPEAFAGTIFDIHSEALSNVARHASASRVAVVLSIAADEVTMVVRDNGIGLADKAPVEGAGGLAAIRACTQTHGGICEIVCAQYAGTSVKVCLPVG